MPEVHVSAKLMKYGLPGLFFISMLLHILIVMKYMRPGFLVIVVLTTGMIFSWLYATRMIRLMGESHPGSNPWQVAIRNCPSWLKYLTGFLFLYAFSNFVIMIDPEPGEGYFHSSLPYGKIRGLSGFWMAFYGLAYAVSIVSSGKPADVSEQDKERS